MSKPTEGKTIRAIPSKSDAHRAYICAAIAGGETAINCSETSLDIEATRECMVALMNSKEDRAGVDLYCRESGSTLRFLLPLVGALGKRGIFHPMGRLSKRPLSPLYEELQKKGMIISAPGSVPLIAEGKLQSGDFVIPGNISSQFVSGLLFALPLLEGDSRIIVTGDFQSRGYSNMTLRTLEEFGIRAYEEKDGDNLIINIPGSQKYNSVKEYNVEGDWSNSAFWFAAGLLGDSPIKVTGLDMNSPQGDKEILRVIQDLGGKIQVEDEGITVYPGKNLKGITFDAGQTPDMIPVVALMATRCKTPTRIVNALRLRTKESDRLHSISGTLRALGADVEELEEGLIINSKRKVEALKGGTVESFDDHRIAMMASIASIICEGKVGLIGWEAVNKSYPSFFEHLRELDLDGNLERM